MVPNGVTPDAVRNPAQLVLAGNLTMHRLVSFGYALPPGKYAVPSPIRLFDGGSALGKDGTPPEWLLTVMPTTLPSSLMSFSPELPLDDLRRAFDHRCKGNRRFPGRSPCPVVTVARRHLEVTRSVDNQCAFL